ncbi:MAG TPA: hypothetical protein VD994_13795 [Prosthecobacter sp.]|nr:hypothetical protein [Prosthecobacter sp.]
MRTYLAITLILSAVAQALSQQPGTPPSGPAAGKPATDGKVWGALIYATNNARGLSGSQEKAPEQFADLQKRLGKVFQYQHFEILGQHLQDVFREYESWVVPTKDLFLKVDSKGPAKGGGMNVHLQFWREQQVLVKTDATLRGGSPLFIGGPKWKEGQLIFVLVLQK